MTKELTKPFALFIIFFVIQTYLRPTELFLTILIIVFSFIILLIKHHKKELLLFIEVILGLIGRQKTWGNASLFGVPFWLPFAWAIGFVIITRLGNKIRS